MRSTAGSAGKPDKDVKQGKYVVHLRLEAMRFISQ
jgi:hypothetical protein